jgi:hypothetical protein
LRLPRRVAAQTTFDCLKDGPQNTPAWALLSEAAKSDLAGRRRRTDGWPTSRMAPTTASGGALSSTPSIETVRAADALTPAASAMPRFDDEKTLVLMEEIRAPQPRQPECGSP